MTKRGLLALALAACGGSPTPVTPPATSAAPRPSASASADGVDCASTATGRDHVELRFDFASMTGVVTVDDGSGDGRTIRAKVVPYSGTYLFMFSGYSPGDHPPSGEKLEVGKSIVARLVMNGDDTFPYFDGDVALHDASGKKIDALAKCGAR